jgi:hypothetical protein
MLSTNSGEVVRLGGSSFPRDLARRTKRQVDLVVAEAEISQAVDQSRALLTSSALNHVGNLTSLAENLAATTPSAAGNLEMLLNAYALGAANQIARIK